MAPPKALLFDIGGVVVVSPFQAIVDYETQNDIPSGWINFTISHSMPNGFWHQLEKGGIELNNDFFKGFSEDLHNAKSWAEFHKRYHGERKRLKDMANPTQLGDPVSLKAETADSEPSDHDRGSRSSSEGNRNISPANSSPKSKTILKDLTKDNPTQLGDPVSLKAETADSEPTDQDRGARSHTLQTTSHSTSSDDTSPKSLKDLAQANPTQLGDPVSLKAEATDSSPTPADRGASSPPAPESLSSQSLPRSSPIPPLPKIDATTLFWNMMTISRTPDPYMHPYLLHLSSLSPRPFLLGALSNTVTFPSSHPFSAPHSTTSAIRSLFDVFIASAEVGLRKPHREIYELALKELDRVSREKQLGPLAAGDVLFLDDIGENLRMGSEVGMRTLRVGLGEGRAAVRELERITGVRMERGGARL